jgi:SAM-dependent methyltransferase
MRARAYVGNAIVLALMVCATGLAVPLAGQQAKQKHVYTNDNLSVPASADPDSATDPAGSKQLLNAVEKGAPYVPTPMQIVDRMLETAGVTPSDVVYDLGSGDGRIVLRAAQRFGAKAVGIEIDPALVKESADRAKEMKLDKLAKFVEGDLFQADVKSATVVALYLVPEMNARLRPLLEKQLRPGSRVVAHDMPVPEWRPASQESILINNTAHTVYLYTVPNSFQKRAAE